MNQFHKIQDSNKISDLIIKIQRLNCKKFKIMKQLLRKFPNYIIIIRKYLSHPFNKERNLLLKIRKKRKFKKKKLIKVRKKI